MSIKRIATTCSILLLRIEVCYNTLVRKEGALMLILEILKAVILGIVQGVSEYLPISSTGHIILVNEFLRLQFSEEFVNTFFVVIQLGSILAVVILYFKKLWPFDFKNTTAKERKSTWVLWSKVLVGCLPAAIVGVLFDDVIDALFYNPTTIAIALIVYGIAFIIIESMHIKVTMKKVEDIDYITAANIGLFQMLALIPGTSRSGSTIIGGRILGCGKESVSEFSFFMAVPVMAGATLLKLVKCGFAFGASEWVVLFVGTVVSFIVSIFSIRFLMNYIKKHDFKAFGFYRIVLGILVLVYFGMVK